MRSDIGGPLVTQRRTDWATKFRLAQLERQADEEKPGIDSIQPKEAPNGQTQVAKSQIAAKKQSIDFLSALDVQSAASGGQWKLEEGKLICEGAERGGARLTFGSIPFKQYDLQVKFIPMGNRGGTVFTDIIFTLPTVRAPVAVRQTLDGSVLIGFWQSGKDGFEDSLLTAPIPGRLQVGRLYSLDVEVRGEDTVTVLLDGQAVLSLNALPDVRRSSLNPSPLLLTLSPKVRVVLERCVVTEGEETIGQGEPQAGDVGIAEVINSIGMKLKLIPAGEFMMGSPVTEEGRLEDELQHRVRITKPFYLGVYEVTQAEYERVMGTNPSWHSENGKKADIVAGLDTSRFPVENVSWEEAVEFCRKLSALAEEKAAGRLYRLPTEAEWEYACRAGTTTRYSFGDDDASIGRYGWYGDNSDNRTHPVGEKEPNAWGLYDMYGNVFDWCQDWYDSGYYENSPTDDPNGPSSGTERALRGTSCGCPPHRTAHRQSRPPQQRTPIWGFRVAADIAQAE